MMSQTENIGHSADGGELSDETFIQSCQFDIETKSPVERSVRVTVPESLLKSEFETTMSMTATQVALPGFRRGRVPKRVLEKRFGEDLRKEFLTTTIRRTLEAIVEQNHFRVLGQPAVEPEDLVLPREGPLTYTLLLEIVPEIPLPDLTTIDLVRPKFEVTEERLGKAFDHLRRTMGVMRPQNGPIESEDQTFIKCEIHRRDGTVVSKIEYGRIYNDDRVSDVEVPGITTLVKGKSVGDTIEHTFRAGQQSGATIPRDEDLVLKGEIIHNSRLEMPEINDEFAKTNGFESVEELRTQMTAAMTKQLERQAAEALRMQLIEAIEKMMTFPVPPRLLQMQLQQTARQEMSKLVRAGMDPKLIVGNSKDFLQRCTPIAESVCIRSIIIQRLAEGVDVEVSKEEVMERLLELSEQSGENPGVFIQRAQESGLTQQLAVDIQNARMLDQFLESCTIRDISEDEWNDLVKQRNAERDAMLAQSSADAAAQRVESGESPAGAVEASSAGMATPESSASDAT